MPTPPARRQHPSNMRFDDPTSAVVNNLETNIVFSDEQPENISLIDATLAVLKPDRSRVVSDEQP